MSHSLAELTGRSFRCNLQAELAELMGRADRQNFIGRIICQLCGRGVTAKKYQNQCEKKKEKRASAAL